MGLLETFRRILVGDVQSGNYAEINHEMLRRYGNLCNSHAEMSRDIDGTQLLALADTYYKITGAWSDLGLLRFTHDGLGKLTYVGPGECMLMLGTSDFSVDKACKTHYGLYLNGSLAPGVSETPHTFTANNKVTSISIVGLVPIVTGDELEIYARSNTADTTINPETLKVVLWGS